MDIEKNIKKSLDGLNREINRLKKIITGNKQGVFPTTPLNVFRLNTSGIDKVDGKLVMVDAVSPYNKISANLVITERIKGKVKKIDDYGITLEDAEKSVYTNGKLTRKDPNKYKSIIIYHHIINYISILE